MREAYRPASDVVCVIVLGSVDMRLMREDGSMSSCSCSKELVVGDGDMAGLCRPLSGAIFNGGNGSHETSSNASPIEEEER